MNKPTTFRLLPTLVLALGAALAQAQQTVTLKPDLPRIVVQANYTNANLYYVPIPVIFAGGSTPVGLSVEGAPSGATAVLSAASLAANGTVTLRVGVTNVAPGVYPLSVIATNIDLTNTATITLVAAHGWIGPTLASSSWGTAANWTSGSSPGMGNNVKVEDDGYGTNIVETSTTIDSLTYSRFTSGRTVGTLIAPNQTLSVLGPFSVNVETTNSNNKTLTVNFNGPRATLLVSNENSVFTVNSVNSGNAGTTLSMTNLDTFRAVVSRFSLGDVTAVQNGAAAQQIVAVRLARTNYVRAGFVGDHTLTEDTNSITIFNNSDRFNNGSAMTVDLGITNVFEADSLGISRTSAGASGNIVRFLAAFVAAGPKPSAVFRAANGGRMPLLTIGVPSDGTNNVQSNSRGTLDLRNGTVWMDVEKLILGANRSNFVYTGASTPNTFGQGAIVFNAGRVNVTTALLGYQRWANDAYARGSISIGGSGVLSVSSNAVLGHTTGFNPATGFPDYIAYGGGTLEATNGGTLQINSATVGEYTTNIIRLNLGTLVLSNQIGTIDYPLSILDINNATNVLHIDGLRTSIYVNMLLPGGLQNVINIASITGVSAPATIPIISYQSLATTPNISLGTLPGGYTGYINHNSGNKTIELVLTTTTSKTLIWSGAVNGNWDTSTPNWINAATLLADTFAQGDFVNFNDSSSGATNVIVTAPMTIGQGGGAGMTISNTALTYSFSGAGKIAGAGLTVKQGAGIATLSCTTESPLLVSAGTLNGNGIMAAATVSAGTTFNLAGSLNGPFVSVGTTTVAGTLAGSVTLQGGTFANSGTVTATFSVTAGSITNLAVGNLNVLNAWTVPTGSRLINHGTITQSGTLSLGGYFGGNGSILNDPFVIADNARVSVNSGSTFSPGASIGQMSVLTRLDLNAGSTNIFEINLATGTNDVVVANTYNFNATAYLYLTNIGPTAFAGGESFQLFRPAFGNNVPNNASVSPIVPSIPALGMVWLTNTAPNFVRTNGYVGVRVMVSTVPTNLVCVVSSTLLTLSWPSSHIGWKLQAQTNAAGISNNWTTITASTNTNTMIITINPSNAPTFHRLVYP